MTHIVIENCIKCKFTDCINICPVDCFHEGENFLVINPNICIDCSICISECPIEAIISDENTYINKNLFLKINFELSKIWPIIKISNNLKINNKWKFIKNKLHLLNIC